MKEIRLKFFKNDTGEGFESQLAAKLFDRAGCSASYWNYQMVCRRRHPLPRSIDARHDFCASQFRKEAHV
jgi:hypothetical protein